MQIFWYHSPVRFYKTKEELSDMTNPQNTQFFGSKNPYPLEIGKYHRFLIPNYQNEVDSTDLQLWLVGDTEILIPCEFGLNDGKLFRVTFISYDWMQGSFEIRKSTGDTLFYSNCVNFIDSTDSEGRKFIRIAAKHYYNEKLFKFDNSNYEWMITNLPGYCLGQFTIDSEFETLRTGDNNGLQIVDNYIDEVVSYEIELGGNSNLSTSIQVYSTFDSLYIDGTKRTIKEKPEIDEQSMIGKFKFVNQKDKNGLNILLDEDAILSDAFKSALGNGEKTLVYVYNQNYIIPTENE